MDVAGASAAAPRTGAIRLERISKRYRRGEAEVEALSDIDITIEQGHFVTLFGPSGCGKSTLLRIVAGLESQTAGVISLFGKTPAEASRRKHVSWVPQSPALLPWLSVLDNVTLSQRINRDADREPDPDRAPQDAREVLSEMGLAEFADARPTQLSGGMRQRAALARGFVLGAPLMLMDEPFSALDELTRDALGWHLLDVWERHRKTVLFVTHSAGEAVLLSDRVVVMTPRPGRVQDVIDITLPRPRPRDIAERHEFVELVLEVKKRLRGQR
ncbi:MAG TPA: ABC transporter ATP-binding protein, partial [Burkholderiaceae bacterium]|nr:ABC transporter ATP-binding protein [Burkholderiaceae bacterium]